MSEKQNAETLELADKLVTIFDRIGVSCDWRLSSEERQDIAKAAVALHALRAAAPSRCDRCGSSGDVFVLCSGCHGPIQSPHPRGEPVGYVSAATISALGQPEGSGPVVACAAFDTIIPLYAAPPPAGADAVTDEMLAISGLNHDWNVAMERAGAAEDALQKIADGYGPQHGSKYCRDIALAALRAPQPQEKPTGDQT